MSRLSTELLERILKVFPLCVSMIKSLGCPMRKPLYAQRSNSSVFDSAKVVSPVVTVYTTADVWFGRGDNFVAVSSYWMSVEVAAVGGAVQHVSDPSASIHDRTAVQQRVQEGRMSSSLERFMVASSSRRVMQTVACTTTLSRDPYPSVY